MGDSTIAPDAPVMLYSVRKTKTFVQDIITNYYSLDDVNNLQPFDKQTFDDSDDYGIYMFAVPNVYTEEFKTNYNLTVDDMGPFSEDKSL